MKTALIKFHFKTDSHHGSIIFGTTHFGIVTAIVNRLCFAHCGVLNLTFSFVAVTALCCSSYVIWCTCVIYISSPEALDHSSHFHTHQKTSPKSFWAEHMEILWHSDSDVM